MSDLSQLIDELPELYQPIFNRPDYTHGSSRACADRLDEISRAYRALARELDRPLRVLDLGCAQGFFSLSLGQLGATVHGVDYLAQNIAVCDALAEENPQLDVTFEMGRIEDVLERLADEQFDIVLGLSVFHHLIHEHGVAPIVTLLDTILNQTGLFICEFALCTEPLYWGPSQPQKPRDLLKNAQFIHEVSRYETHLADIKRPLYVASNMYWCIGDLLGNIELSTAESHPLADGAHRGARHYIFSSQHIIKIFEHDAEYAERGKVEILHEAEFLQRPPTGFPVPALYDVGVNEGEAWLVMERLPGRLLVELILDKTPYDGQSIISAILRQLALLEAGGFYHDDLRVWNVLVDVQGRAQLIDFGSISLKPLDVVWPHNVFLAALIFIKEVMAAKVDRPGFLREVAISPASLPQPISAWMTPLWSTPPSQWSFRLMQELFENGMAGRESMPADDALSLWMAGIEGAVQTLKQHLNHVEHKVDRKPGTFDMASIPARRRDEPEIRARAAESQLVEVTAELTHHQIELRDWINKSGHLEQDLRQTRIELQASLDNAHLWFVRASQLEAALGVVQNSSSWKATAPLRWARLRATGLPRSVARSCARSMAPLLARCIRIAVGAPTINTVARNFFRRYPIAYQHLRLFAHRRGLIAGHPAPGEVFGAGVNVRAEPTEFVPGHGPLSPKGDLIYQEITRQMVQKENQ
jgi:O-antigen chain-terminating methyltransferase